MLGFSLVTWVGFGISLITVPFTTRLFLPEELGVINLYGTFSYLMLTFVYIGLDQAYLRFYHEPPNNQTKKDLLSFCIFVTGGLSILVFIVALLLKSTLSIAISGENQIWLIVCLGVSVIANVAIKFLNLNYRMRQDILWFTIQGVLIVIVGKVSYLFAAFYLPSYKSAIITMTVTQALLATVFMILQRSQYLPIKLHYDKTMAKDLLRFALPIMPLGVIAWLNSSVAQLMLRKYVNFEAIGVYSIALAIASLIGLLQAGFNTYWAAFVFENYKTESERIKKVHDLVTFAMVFLGMCVVLSQDVIFLVVGSRYLHAKTFFPFLLISPIAYTISETTGLGINISKKTYYNTFNFAISVIVNIIVCLVALPKLGILGTAIASATSALFLLALRTYFGEKYYKSIKSYIPMLRSLTLMILMAIVNVVFYNQHIIKYLLFLALILTLILLNKTHFKNIENIMLTNIGNILSKSRKKIRCF